MPGLKGISRLGDITTGHGCHAPVIGAIASPNVYVNGLPAHKVGDTTVPHTCGTDVHPDTMSVGSSTVKINGTDAMRIGDTLTPGGTMAEGSHNVFAGV
jgi:uncharacterized Zn-binding protein involved in type VI secretion